jgi:LPXTG-motif cell wall-anchored protein
LVVLGAPALADESETPVPPPPSDTSESVTPPSSAPATPVAEPPAQQQEEPPVQADPKSDLTVKVEYDDHAYLVGQEVPLTITVENVGDADAKGVQGFAGVKSGSSFFVGGLGDFTRPEGATVPAKSSTVLHVNGQISEWKDGDSVVRFEFRNAADANSADNVVEKTFKVVSPTTTGTVGGFLYGDANDNGRYDTGEGLPDVKLTLRTTGTSPPAPAETTTDATGRFDIKDLPARAYSLDFAPRLPGNWVTTGAAGPLLVDGSGKTAELRLRATRPLSDTLKVTAKFNEGPYKPGDEAHLTITLTNSGSKPLEHIVASCDRAGFGNKHLIGSDDPARWGDLTYKAGGASVGVGQTATFTVSGTVPDGAIDDGAVYIACDFGPVDQEFVEGYPGVFTLAKVPGKTGTFSAEFYQDLNDNSTIDDGELITGIEVGLVDPFDGSAVAKAKAGADGVVDFGTLPAGYYGLDFFKKWAVKEGRYIVVSADSPGTWAIKVVPGPGDDDTTPAGPIPAKQVQGLNLASTGASVVSPAIGGVALLLVGVGVVLFTRRRRRSS